VKSVALFNNKGGVGKTTLTYHLAHMLQRLGQRVLAVDLDPQSNLTANFLNDDDLSVLWEESDRQAGSHAADSTMHAPTVAAAVRPIREGIGDVLLCEPIPIGPDGLFLLAGDLTLSTFEDRLSEAWPKGFTGDPAALRTTTAFHRIVQSASRAIDADVVLIDVGPNLGAINRAALLTADTVLIPLAADLFSLRGLQNLGPTLRTWRRTWQTKVLPDLPPGIDAPVGSMTPIGYVIMQPTMRLDRPVKAYRRWLDRIPTVFAQAVDGDQTKLSFEIATLRNYQSLMPLAHDARKPMFDLRTADGALGSTQTLVNRCQQDFRALATELLRRLDAVKV